MGPCNGGGNAMCVCVCMLAAGCPDRSCYHLSGCFGPYLLVCCWVVLTRPTNQPTNHRLSTNHTYFWWHKATEGVAAFGACSEPRIMGATLRRCL